MTITTLTIMSQAGVKLLIDIITYIAITLTIMLAGFCTLIASVALSVGLSYNPKPALETTLTLAPTLLFLTPAFALCALNTPLLNTKKKLRFILFILVFISGIALYKIAKNMLKEDPGDSLIYTPFTILGLALLASAILLLIKEYYTHIEKS